MAVPPETIFLWVMTPCGYGADYCFGVTCYPLLQGTKYFVFCNSGNKIQIYTVLNVYNLSYFCLWVSNFVPAVNPLNVQLNPICHLLILLRDLTFMGMCIVSISNKIQRYTVYLYLETSLHVSGGISTHHQERIQLYLQHLVTMWQIPDAVDTVVCAPDDGWKYHAKHVEQFPDINKQCNVSSCWIYIGILLEAHPIFHISGIKVNERTNVRSVQGQQCWEKFWWQVEARSGKQNQTERKRNEWAKLVFGMGR
jgi:hypothetical protein